MGWNTTPPWARRLIGKIVGGRYGLKKLIGVGGMGAVYGARCLRTGGEAAVKVLAPQVESPVHRRRFIREGETVARLSSEHIVAVNDVGEDPPFIAMEYLDGCDLATLLRAQGPLPWPRAKQFALQMCAGLGVAHDHGVTHRDLKPSNCFVTPSDHVKLLDFGIAYVRHEPRLTGAHEVLGTSEYMAPEQIKCEEVDERADIYALGVVLFEMLAGAVPFRGNTTYEIQLKHLREPVPSVADKSPDIPWPVVEIVRRAMGKRPEDRYASSREMAAALHAADGWRSKLPRLERWRRS